MSRYALYRSNLAVMHRALRREPHFRKCKTAWDTVSKAFHEAPGMLEMTDTVILAHELLWELEGSPVVFPESAEFVRDLLSANIDPGESAGINLPFRSMVIALPDDMDIDGVRLRPTLVSQYRFADTDPMIIHPLMKKMGFPQDKVGSKMLDTYPDERCLMMISDADPDPETGFPSKQHLLVLDNKISTALNTGSTASFRSVIGVAPKNGLVPMDQSSTELEEQALLLRLVCALSIYHSATDGAMLKTGLPGNAPAKQFMADGRLPKQITSHCIGPGVKRDSPDTHYRKFHFRQLRDQRYYRGEHAALAPGSRWVFVRDSVVGETTPYTAESSRAG